MRRVRSASRMLTPACAAARRVVRQGQGAHARQNALVPPPGTKPRPAVGVQSGPERLVEAAVTGKTAIASLRLPRSVRSSPRSRPSRKSARNRSSYRRRSATPNSSRRAPSRYRHSPDEDGGHVELAPRRRGGVPAAQRRGCGRRPGLRREPCRGPAWNSGRAFDRHLPEEVGSFDSMCAYSDPFWTPSACARDRRSKCRGQPFSAKRRAAARVSSRSSRRAHLDCTQANDRSGRRHANAR